MPPQQYGPNVAPFDSQLQPRQPGPLDHVQEFSGREGKAGSAFGIAAKFLQGVAQGRAADFAKKEAARGQEAAATMEWIDSVRNRKDLTDEVKSQFETDAHSALAEAAKGVIKQGDKNSPVIGTMKSILTGLTGGEMKGKINPEPFKDLRAKYADVLTSPDNLRQTHIEKAQNDFQAAVQELQGKGGDVTHEMVLQHPGAQSAMQRLIKHDPQARDKIGLMTGGFQQAPAIPQRGSPQAAMDKLTSQTDASAQPPRVSGDEQGPAREAEGAGDTRMREKSGMGPQPPAPRTREEIDAVQSKVEQGRQKWSLATQANLVSSPQWVSVNGVPTAAVSVAAGPGIEAGFYTQTGEKITGKIEPYHFQTAREPKYFKAEDKEGHYGQKGGLYYEVMGVDGRPTPMRDSKTGQIVRPPTPRQANSLQGIAKDARRDLIREMDSYKNRIAKIDDEQTRRIQDLEKPATGGAPPISAADRERRRKDIYTEISRKKDQAKQDRDQMLQAIQMSTGVSRYAALTAKESEDMDDDSSESIPETNTALTPEQSRSIVDKIKSYRSQ